jgi:hypothetical protein
MPACHAGCYSLSGMYKVLSRFLTKIFIPTGNLFPYNIVIRGFETRVFPRYSFCGILFLHDLLRKKMKTPAAIASRVIHAPAEQVYRIIADYRNLHPRILPKGYFLSIHVEEGGVGAGTIVSFTMRILGRTQSFRSLITEPEPGRLLVETDIRSKTVTSFQVMPLGDLSGTRVTISTGLEERNWVEAFLAKPILQKIYRQELELLARLAEDPSTLQ